MRRPPKLVARQAAFLSTFNLLAGEIAPKWLENWREPPQLVYFQGGGAEQVIPMAGSDILAALVSASAALVVGADLDDSPYVPQMQTQFPVCDDCGRYDGTHDLEVEH